MDCGARAPRQRDRVPKRFVPNPSQTRSRGIGARPATSAAHNHGPSRTEGRAASSNRAGGSRAGSGLEVKLCLYHRPHLIPRP